MASASAARAPTGNTSRSTAAPVNSPYFMGIPPPERIASPLSRIAAARGTATTIFRGGATLIGWGCRLNRSLLQEALAQAGPEWLAGGADARPAEPCRTGLPEGNPQPGWRRKDGVARRDRRPVERARSLRDG